MISVFSPSIPKYSPAFPNILIENFSTNFQPIPIRFVTKSKRKEIPTHSNSFQTDSRALSRSNLKCFQSSVFSVASSLHRVRPKSARLFVLHFDLPPLTPRSTSVPHAIVYIGNCPRMILYLHRSARIDSCAALECNRATHQLINFIWLPPIAG